MISQSRLGILLIFFECKTGIGWSPAVSHIYKYKCHLHSSQIFKKFQINPLPRKEFSMPLPCPPAQWGNARCFLKIMNRQLLVEISLLPSKHQTYQWNMAERQNCWFDTFGDNNLDWSAWEKKTVIELRIKPVPIFHPSIVFILRLDSHPHSSAVFPFL